jgi:hypothetical protein
MAERIGFKAGDIIEEVLNLPVSTVEEAVAALKAGGSRGAEVLINRRGEKIVLTIAP